jgi:hypothetical protein
MGELLCRYWISVLASCGLGKGSIRMIRILCKDTVLFRDTDGRPGLLEEHCPHHRTTLTLACIDEYIAPIQINLHNNPRLLGIAFPSVLRYKYLCEYLCVFATGSWVQPWINLCTTKVGRYSDYLVPWFGLIWAVYKLILFPIATLGVLLSGRHAGQCIMTCLPDTLKKPQMAVAKPGARDSACQRPGIVEKTCLSKEKD